MNQDDLTRVRDAYPILLKDSPPATTITRLQAAYVESEAPAPEAVTRPLKERRRWPSGRVGLLALGAMVVSGTAVAATVGGWHPQLGSPGRGSPPRPAAASVPATQLSLLAVLRRPQTDADRGHLVQLALRRLDRDTINGVHTDAIRVIDHGPRSATILIPAERSGPVEPRLKNLSSRDVLCLETIAYMPAQTITNGSRTIRFPAGYSGGGTCGTTAALRTTGLRTGTGDTPIMSGPVDYEHGPLTRYVTLVPDGVAKVTVNLRHRRTVTVPVRDNIYRFAVPGIASQFGTIWYDKTGQRIEHRKRP